MLVRATTITTLLLAALALPGAARAADVPGNSSTRAVLRTGPAGIKGTVDNYNDIDWYRVTLKGGQNYAFNFKGLTENGCVRLNLLSPSGQLLYIAGIDRGPTGGLEDGEHGFEFRSRTTRTFFAEFRSCESDVPGTFPSRFSSNVIADARGDATTAATIQPGQTINGLMNWGNDEDWFRTRLERGRTYTLTTASPDLFASLLDAKGNEICLTFATDSEGSCTGISVPSTGTYFVKAENATDFSRRYSVRLSRP